MMRAPEARRAAGGMEVEADMMADRRERSGVASAESGRAEKVSRMAVIAKEEREM